MIIEKRVTPHSRLGFIGLGYLGSRIARRLVAAGFPIVVHDRDRKKTEEFVHESGLEAKARPAVLTP